MDKPTSTGTDQAKPAVTKAEIVEVIIRYKEKGTNKPLLVRFDPKKINADGVIWDPTRLSDFEGAGCKLDRKKAESTDNFPEPEDDNLPLLPTKQSPEGKNTNTVPEATCCYVNGRWICWD
jgi:hypothetical protein